MIRMRSNISAITGKIGRVVRPQWLLEKREGVESVDEVVSGRTHLRLERQEALARADYKAFRAFEGTYWFPHYFRIDIIKPYMTMLH